ncbi:hypothetical protein ABQG68_19790, partial [Bacillus pumilus]|uniref:hypothetical protein n=1 Tax=Bacillus pumilus TaxID=1408 RepID=UPI003314BC64
SKTKYTDVELEAGVIRYDNVSNTVAAFGNTDTSNSLKSKPILRQGGTESINDSIFFNLKSKKGLTKNSFYQEGEMFVYASRLKKLDNEVLFGEQGRFTTCNLDEPHFAFRTKKMKLVSKKLAITGPAFPEFEGIPIPVGIPFGIYPLSR